MSKSSNARRGFVAMAIASLLCIGTGVGVGSGNAAASSRPPLRVILPVSAGSAVDVIVRSAQPALIKALDGQAVVIENLPGAGGIPGTQALVHAAPDGNTIAFLSNNHAVNPSVFRKLPYDSLKDITPITVVAGSPFLLVVNPAKLPARNARELQALLKASPDAYNYGSSGNGTIIHLAGEMFNEAIDVPIRHVPYKGTGPMITDIIGGQVEMGVGAVAAVLSQVKAGQLRAIGVMGPKRIASMPDLPTIAEQGFPDVDIAGWFVAAGPKGLPAAEVKRLRDAIVTAFNDPDVKEGFARRDDYLILSPTEETASFLQAEVERYGKLVRKAKVSLD